MQLLASIGKYKEDRIEQANQRGVIYACAVTARREQDLVWDRRRFDSSYDRYSKDLEQCYAAEHFGVAEDFRDWSRTFRRDTAYAAV